MAQPPLKKPAAKNNAAAKTPATSKTKPSTAAQPTLAANSKATAVKPSVKPTQAAKPVTAKKDTAKKDTPSASMPPAAKNSHRGPAPAKKATSAIKVMNQAAVKASDKPAKIKMERDSFTMPKEEYAQIAVLKKRLESVGQPAKKSELLRAGLALLSKLDDAALKATLAAVPTIKTGRPKK